MNEKFTLGTWTADTESGYISVLGEVAPIAKLYGKPSTNVDTDVASRMLETQEYEANLRLLAHAKDLYFTLELSRPFVPEDTSIRESVDKLLREINPDFGKHPEVTDIRKFAERVKNMRDWQKEHLQNPSSDTERYSASNEDLIDSIVAEILEEAKS